MIEMPLLAKNWLKGKNPTSHVLIQLWKGVVKTEIFQRIVRLCVHNEMLPCHDPHVANERKCITHHKRDIQSPQNLE